MSTTGNSTIANSIGNHGRLRRSSRAPKKPAAEFLVGDVVEIQRGTSTVQAQLVQLLTEGTVSPNPRWLIRYIINSKDEEVYEHSFIGKVGMNGDYAPTGQLDEQNTIDEESSAFPDQPQLTSDEPAAENSRISKKKKTEDANGINLTAHSDSSGGRKVSTKIKPVVTSKSSNKNNAVSASSREARSRRRGGQPLLGKEFNGEQQYEEGLTDERLPQSIGEIPSQQQLQRKRKLTGAAKISVETKRERESKGTKSSTVTSLSVGSAGAATKQQPQQKEEEECVKIKFLTGTLYLYRGKRRRAEFVRRV